MYARHWVRPLRRQDGGHNPYTAHEFTEGQTSLSVINSTQCVSIFFTSLFITHKSSSSSSEADGILFSKTLQRSQSPPPYSKVIRYKPTSFENTHRITWRLAQFNLHLTKFVRCYVSVPPTGIHAPPCQSRYERGCKKHNMLRDSKCIMILVLILY